ncbi:MAG: SPFH domain-containing protein [Candidatus Thorarchaeota archaeon]
MELQTGLEPVLLSSLIAILAMFLLMFVASGIKVLREWERVAILRLGKFKGIKGPGVIWIMPLLDKVVMKVSLQQQTYTLKMDDLLTRDNVSIVLTARLDYKITDVETMFKSNAECPAIIEVTAQTTLREAIGTFTLDELHSDGDDITKRLQELMNLKTEQVGITVSTIELQDLHVLP